MNDLLDAAYATGYAHHAWTLTHLKDTSARKNPFTEKYKLILAQADLDTFVDVSRAFDEGLTQATEDFHAAV